MRHFTTNLRDLPNDLVPGNHREEGIAPLTPRLMNIGVADTAVLDCDQHVAWTDRTTLKGEWFQRRASGGGGVTLTFDHKEPQKRVSAM
jgi:hypothetical protein